MVNRKIVKLCIDQRDVETKKMPFREAAPEITQQLGFS
jgi:hypothetical protein